jgi:hypothetical protein
MLARLIAAREKGKAVKMFFLASLVTATLCQPVFARPPSAGGFKTFNKSSS